MDSPTLATLDLNLLRVFHVLMEEGSATRAAQRLGLTQSAISHALKRLRMALNDDLFVRVSDGMRPTAWAIEAAPLLAEALGQIERALAPRRFSPEDSHRTFHVCAAPYAASILLPRVVGRCRQEAPNAKLSVRAWDQASADFLDTGRADIAIGIFRSSPERFESETLFEERLVYAVRNDLADRSSFPNIVKVDYPEEMGGYDLSAPADRPKESTSAAIAPDWHCAIAIAANSNLAAFAPERLVRAYQAHLPIACVRPLNDPPRLQIRALWRRENSAHPAIIWLRDILREEAANVDA
jgi:DNA-binding transcriptional LysR family regulator